MSTAAGDTTSPTTQPTTPATTPTTPATTPTTATTPTVATTPTTAAPPPTTAAPPPVTTSVTTAASAPQSTTVITSVVTAPPTQQTSTPPTTAASSPLDTSSSSSSNAGQTTNVPTTTATSSPANSSSGLSTGGKTAIAVVIPIVAVALIIIAAIWFWRRRKQRQADEEDRRKELEAYGYNPNNDPTLPGAAAIGTTKDEGLVGDDAGYRGWGGPAGTVGRKTSTNASSGGAPFSSDASTAYAGPASPTPGQYAAHDGIPGEAITTVGHHRNGTLDSDTMGNFAGGAAAGAAGAAAAGGAGTNLRRGASNASSTYSAGHQSQNSNDYPLPHNPNNNEYYTDNGYYQPGPYDQNYNGGGQPIMRESPARRLTQINENNVNPQQGGIARNF